MKIHYIYLKYHLALILCFSLQNLFIYVLFYLILTNSPVKLSSCYCCHVTYKQTDSNKTWLRECYQPFIQELRLETYQSSILPPIAIWYKISYSLLNCFHICLLFFSIPIAITSNFISNSTQYIASIQWISLLREGGRQ